MKPWTPNWEALAKRCVHDTMRVQPGERVVIQGDPLRVPEFYEAVRYEVLAAGGIEHAHVLGWNGRLHELRSPFGRHPDERVSAEEIQSLRQVLAGADVFLWLPLTLDPVGCAGGYSEEVLSDWPGRGLHFHWFDDWYLSPDDPLQVELAQTLERAVLELDYDEHRATQLRLLDAVRGALLHVTTAEGTDVRVQLDRDGWYHVNDGRTTPEKTAAAGCARDREEELPCGSVRSIPVIESVEGVVQLRQPGKAVGSIGHKLLDISGDLTFEYEQGKAVRSSAGSRDKQWQELWSRQTGAYDEVTEVVFGTNPFLQDIPGLPMPPYWGFGEGIFRLHTGSNLESGGDRTGSLSLEVWLRNATVQADGQDVVVDGKLVV